MSIGPLVSEYYNCDLNLPYDDIGKKLYDIEKMEKRDRSCLSEHKKISNGLFEGQSTENIDGVEVKYVFFKGNDKYLHVFLSGFVKNPRASYQRWSFNAEGNTLAVADPMFTLHGVPLGWYFGTRNVDYRRIVARLIQKIIDFLGISNNCVFIYGGSGGATAAIYVGSYIPGCTVLAINPQIDILKWGKKYTRKLESVTGPISEDMLMGRNDIYSTILGHSETKYIFAINWLSKIDFQSYRELANKLGVQLVFGVSQSSNVISWIYEAEASPNGVGLPDYHGSMDDIRIYNFLNELLIDVSNNLELDLNKYLQYTLLWREIFRLKAKLYIQTLTDNSRFDDGKSEYILYQMYLHGIGVNRSESLAIDHLIGSSVRGYGDSLAELYQVGLDTTDKSLFDRIINVFSVVAVGSSEICDKLYLLYSKSKWIDLEKALLWKEKLIDLGDKDYKHYLELLWRFDDFDSLRRLVEFCNRIIGSEDNPYGYAYLGAAYYFGRGIEKNVEKAIFNLNVASSRGVGVAVKLLREIQANSSSS